jgi:hypothetical protein
VNASLAARGYLDGKGNVRSAAELAGRMRREASDYLDALGMRPRSRAKLGLDLARTTDLATAMSEEDPTRHAELLSEAGVDPEDRRHEGPPCPPLKDLRLPSWRAHPACTYEQFFEIRTRGAAVKPKPVPYVTATRVSGAPPMIEARLRPLSVERGPLAQNAVLAPLVGALGDPGLPVNPCPLLTRTSGVVLEGHSTFPHPLAGQPVASEEHKGRCHRAGDYANRKGREEGG